MNNNVFIVLQKYSLEVLFLALLVLLAYKLLKKAMKARLKKFSFYLPYLLGILFYFAYSVIFLKSKENIINMGITTGAIAMIYDAIAFSDKSELTSLLSVIVEEKNLDTAEKEIRECKFDKTETERILKKYSALPLGETELNNLISLILQKKN